MKRTTFSVIMSILLILAGLVAQAGGAWGVVECVALGKVDDAFNDSFDSVTQLEDAIKQLKNTEDDYYKGTTAIVTGENKLYEGRQTVSDNEAKLARGKAQLAEAQAQYDASVDELNTAKAVISDAEAQMDAARDDYEKGQETIAKAEKLVPLLDTYVKVRKGIAIIPGVKSAQEWYEIKVIPKGLELGLDMPDSVDEFEPFVNDLIQQGRDALAAYEDAQEVLNEGKRQVAKAEAQLAEAKYVLDTSKSALNKGQSEIDRANSKLAYAASQIAEGKKTLEQYDEAVGQLADGLMEFLKLEAVPDRRGGVAVESISARLGKDFDIYQHNEKGEVLALENGNPRLDYNKCLKICTAYREYVGDYVEDLNDELMLRYPLAALVALCGLAAVVTGILALCRKKVSRMLGMTIVLLLLVINAFGVVVGYFKFTYPAEEAMYSGIIPAIAAALFLPIAMLFGLSVRSPVTALAPVTVPAEPEAEEEPADSEEKSEDKADSEDASEKEEALPASDEEMKAIRQEAIRQYNEALLKYERAKADAEKIN